MTYDIIMIIIQYIYADGDGGFVEGSALLPVGQNELWDVTRAFSWSLYDVTQWYAHQGIGAPCNGNSLAFGTSDPYWHHQERRDTQLKPHLHLVHGLDCAQVFCWISLQGALNSWPVG